MICDRVYYVDPKKMNFNLINFSGAYFCYIGRFFLPLFSFIQPRGGRGEKR